MMIDRVPPEQRGILERHMARPPVKVGALAQELGLVVVQSSLPAQIAGLIEPSKLAPAGFQIKVNRYDQKERQRFTIAHEIAHFLLHRDYISSGIIDSIMYRSKLSNSKEVEANKLAAEIVMPANLIRAAIRHHDGDVDGTFALDLARDFEVSPSAMRVRLGLSV